MSTTRTTPRAVPPKRRSYDHCDQCGRRLPPGFSTGGQVRGPWFCSYACRLAYETPGCKCCGRGVPAYTRLTLRRRIGRWIERMGGAS